MKTGKETDYEEKAEAKKQEKQNRKTIQHKQIKNMTE